jgi:hypothetical protein
MDVLDIHKGVDLLDVSEEIKMKCVEEYPYLLPEFVFTVFLMILILLFLIHIGFDN